MEGLGNLARWRLTAGQAADKAYDCDALLETITADIELPEGGGNGMIVTEGGLGLYLRDGRPTFVCSFS